MRRIIPYVELLVKRELTRMCLCSKHVGVILHIKYFGVK
jgi:hypothetical protein